MNDTRSSQYADELWQHRRTWWKRLLPVQLPYRLNLRAQRLGACLEVGCGTGRNLFALGRGSLGVDHNVQLVARAREQGLNAVTTEEFQRNPPPPASFDSLLFAHILEHMTRAEGIALVEQYLPYLKSGGAVFVVCPQERGFLRDRTHVQFVTDGDIREVMNQLGIRVARSYSFPFPRPVGRFFVFNEFCVLGRTEVA